MIALATAILSFSFFSMKSLIIQASAIEVYCFTDAKGSIHYSKAPQKSYSENKISSAIEPARINKLPPNIQSAAPLFSIDKIACLPRRKNTDVRNSALKDNLNNIVEKISNQFHLPSALVRAVIKVESNFNRYALSSKGAVGLMQIMPSNFNMLNIDDPYDPVQNIRGGTQYLRTLLNQFNGDLPLALAAYNAGPNAVKQYKGIPPYKETQRYVKKVLSYFKKSF
ncbi:MAG: lytic transglycosylase domain-containing protein [Desulfobacteraceae bacterium]|nr:lytic transglycosylase domain-containing protein [Desulfobacteraceae bacterium]